jgi:hypothetical protein
MWRHVKMVQSLQCLIRRARAPRIQQLPFSARRAAQAAILLLSFVFAAETMGAGGHTVLLTRKYRPGESMVYITTVHAISKFESNPPNLKDFFPPMPTDLRLSQQCTVRVSKVNIDGAADIQHRFDKFEVQTEMASLPQNIRESVTQAQEEVSQRMVGQTLTAHYDHDRHLINFEGAGGFLQHVDAPVKEPLMQMLRLYLEQMDGQSVYPDHPIKVGEQWSQTLDSPPTSDYQFQQQGKSTFQYSGKTRYKGVKAAIVDYHIENALTPALEGLRKDGVLPQLESLGAKLDIKITGKGEGRILVALDDGRVLQNHYTLHQTMSALMKGMEALVGPSSEPPRLEIQSDTEMDVDGSKP